MSYSIFSDEDDVGLESDAGLTISDRSPLLPRRRIDSYDGDQLLMDPVGAINSPFDDDPYGDEEALLGKPDMPFYENYWDRARIRLKGRAFSVINGLWSHRIMISVFFFLLFALSMLVAYVYPWNTLTWKGYVAIVVLLGECSVLVTNTLPSSVVFLGGLVILYCSGILDSDSAFSGFSDPGVILVASTYVVARVLELANVYRYLFKYVFGHPKTVRSTLCVVLPTVCLLSAFMNESTVIGTLTRTMIVWAQRLKLPVQQVLLPMLFSILLGSTITLLGCGTNILIAQLANNRDPTLTFETFQMAYVALPLCAVGILYLVIFAPFILPAALLPEKEANRAAATDRVFCAKVKVVDASPMVGQTYSDAGLEVPGVTIVQILSQEGDVRYSWLSELQKPSTESISDSEDDGTSTISLSSNGYTSRPKSMEISSFEPCATLVPVLQEAPPSPRTRSPRTPSPRIGRPRSATTESFTPPNLSVTNSPYSHNRKRSSTILRLKRVQKKKETCVGLGELIVESNDEIWVCASLKPLMVVYKIDGVAAVSPEVNYVTGSRTQRRIVEAVVSPTSILTSVEIHHSNFRRAYNACILAVYRAGCHYFFSDSEPIQILTGDVLLLETTIDSAREMREKHEFALVTTFLKESIAKRGHGAVGAMVTTGLFVAILVVSSIQILSLSQGFLMLVVIYMLLNLITYKQVMGSIQAEVLLTMAASFATEAALNETSAAEVISDSLYYLTKPFGQLGVYAVVYIMGFLITQFITNSATGSLMFSIAYQLATTSRSNVKGVVYVLMFACSASFLTPIGYCANMVIAKRGKYVLKDFLKFGAALSVLDMIVVLAMHMLLYPAET